MKGKIRTFLVDLLTVTVGNLLVFLRPNKVRELSENGISLVLNNNLSPTERLMRRALLKKMESSKDFDALARLHKNYWVNQGDDFVNVTENNLENIHLPNYKFVFDLLADQITQHSLQFDTLVEIGTGNGSVLNYLSTKFPTINNFVGIDLSEKQIETNKATFSENSKLEFVAADAIEWFKNQQKRDQIVLTFRGVFEYFTQHQLAKFLAKINSLGNIVFIAIEPVGEGHDFKTMFDSQIYGVEGSFSHNYIKQFQDAGFSVWHYELKKETGYENPMSIVCAQNF